MKNKKYGYMIKTVDKNLQGYGGFQYPKNGLVEAPDWTPKPTCNGGIFGLIHDTYHHMISDKPIWMVLKYETESSVVVDNEKIKVPKAWVVSVGSAGEMQSLFEKKTSKPYSYDYSTQTAVNRSTQTAGNRSTQTAGYESTQTAGYESTQTAGFKSTQTAGDGSVSIIRGTQATVNHKGKVLQVFVFCYAGEYIYLTKVIDEDRKMILECKFIDGEWKIEEVKND
jgi:hypothetical protein